MNLGLGISQWGGLTTYILKIPADIEIISSELYHISSSFSSVIFYSCIVFFGSIDITVTKNIGYKIDVAGFPVKVGSVGTA